MKRRTKLLTGCPLCGGAWTHVSGIVRCSSDECKYTPSLRRDFDPYYHRGHSPNIDLETPASRGEGSRYKELDFE